MVINAGQRTVAVKVLRSSLGIPLNEAAELLHEAGPIFVGTEAEAAWVAGEMRTAGIEASVRPHRAH